MNIYKQTQIEELSNILKNDGVISVPTDTVYGICACIKSSKAYDKLVHIKNRPSTKSFPIMCADETQINSIAIVNDNAKKLIHAFMPGPITLVLNKKPEISKTINNAGLRTTSEVAIRMATSTALKELILKVGPIFMTSANKSGEPVCKTLDDIKKVCPELDGIMEGDVTFSKESTIVDCTSDVIKIQRQGVISVEQINKILQN